MRFKKILTVLLSVTMLAAFSACGEKEETSKNDEIATETVAVDEEKAEEEAEAAAKAEAEAEKAAENEDAVAQAEAEDDPVDDIVDNFDAENPEETVLALLESGFSTTFPDSMNVEYEEDSKTYVISVWQEGFAEAVETEEGKSALNTLKDTLSTSIESMLTSVRIMDEDANIKFKFLSDEDKETVLLEITNNEVTHNIAE